MANQAPDPKRVVLSTHRVAYAYLGGRNKKMDDGTEKFVYEVTFLIPKGHPDVAKIEAAQMAAHAQEAQGKFKGIPYTADRIKKKLSDGDKYMAEGREDLDFYKGMMFLSLSSSQPIPMFDEYGQDILDPKKIKSGDYCRGVIKAWPYDNQSKGITFFLDSVKKVAEGEALAGGSNASASDYDEEADYSGAIAPSVPAPSAPVPPRAPAPPVAAVPSRPAAPAMPPAPAPVAPPAPVQPEPIWEKTADGRDIYSFDGGANWNYAE